MHPQGIRDTDSRSMGPDSSSNGEELVDRLVKKLVPSSFDTGKDFWPRGCIEEIVTPETITEELQSCKANQMTLSAVVDFIMDEAQMTFAIALCSSLTGDKLLRAMLQFKNLGFNDSTLPVDDDDEHVFYPSAEKGYRSPWSGLAVRNFRLYQYCSLAPVFDNMGHVMVLHPKATFPFTRVSSHGSSGTFGEVLKITIRAEHQKNGAHTHVAIKRLNHTYNNDEDEQSKLDARWDNEVTALKKISGLRHPNIVQFMTAMTRGRERYLMFEWADGGNLREFWTQPPRLTGTLVKNVVAQLRGLAHALEKMHCLNYRHGDMKPDNILRIKINAAQGTPTDDIGTLKICDMGLSKQHVKETRLRQTATKTRFTTWRYEPPEVADPNNAWSRRYDTWSFGCITLEFIVWLVSGRNGLDRFNEKIVDNLRRECHYFEERQNGDVRVHSEVLAMMESLSKNPQCRRGESALGDLLNLVSTRLLVVALEDQPVGRGTADGQYFNTQGKARAESPELRMALDSIIQKGDADRAYWLKGERIDDLPSLRTPQTATSDPQPRSSLIVASERPSGQVGGLLTTGSSSSLLVPILTGSLRFQLNHEWEFPVDNHFAANIVSDAEMPVSNDTISNRRCAKCQRLEFWKPHFCIVDNWEELESRHQTCDFCRMRWEVCRNLGREESSALRFDRDQSMLKLNGKYPPVLSISRGPESQKSDASHIQIGYSWLPESSSQAHFDILRHCLRDCEINHPECRPKKTKSLPKRLIHLGSKDSNEITLQMTQSADNIEYVALSHPWGKGSHFCTTLENFAAHQKGIDLENLPATFKDAVVTIRELGLEYLWIDSICIIQGEGGDFDQEAKRMEDVFSSAFCVIAASSAQGQYDGFLSRQDQQHECLTFEHAGMPPLYVRRFMDDFNKDVLESPLSRRGWVLQERALARRTIYFTSNQTYWECGKGVRCETLTKMDNKLASFLGDPNFPSKLSNDATTRGVKIRLYEDLYQQYTRLQFSRISDRPIAIAGLERRLIRDLKAQGGFGVFDDGRSLFQRSLLWQRGRGVPPLVKIPSAPSLPVPTWSWMGYDGGIDFVDLPLGGVYWFPDSIKSPWATGCSDTWHTGDGKEFVELKAWARPFDPRSMGLASQDEVELVFDGQDTAEWEGKDLMCVVAGREKKSSCDIVEMAHFILMITRSEEWLGSREERTVCERVGVGRVIGKHLDLKSSPVAVVIR